MPLVLQHQTAEQFATRYWQAVQEAENSGDTVRQTRLLAWLEQRLSDGDLTELQARTAFNSVYERGLTQAQWAQMRASRIRPASDRWRAIKAEGKL